MRIVLAGLLMGFAGAAYAQCPAGIPPSPNCAPPDAPGWRHNLPATGGDTPRPPPRWQSTWGAIAADGVNAKLGTATGIASKQDAEEIALAQCRERGGQDCIVDISYSDQCAVLVTGDKNYSVQTAASIERAAELAMKRCNSSDTGCRVYYSDCSLPVRIQ